MDLIEFTHSKTGMEDEYQKILKSELEMIRYNTGDFRIKQSLNERYEELHRRRDRYFESIQNMMTELLLTERALHEIDDNWNNKEYWGEE